MIFNNLKDLKNEINSKFNSGKFFASAIVPGTSSGFRSSNKEEKKLITDISSQTEKSIGAIANKLNFRLSKERTEELVRVMKSQKLLSRVDGDKLKSISSGFVKINKQTAGSEHSVNMEVKMLSDEILDNINLLNTLSQKITDQRESDMSIIFEWVQENKYKENITEYDLDFFIDMKSAEGNPPIEEIDKVIYSILLCSTISSACNLSSFALNFASDETKWDREQYSSLEEMVFDKIARDNGDVIVEISDTQKNNMKMISNFAYIIDYIRKSNDTKITESLNNSLIDFINTELKGKSI